MLRERDSSLSFSHSTLVLTSRHRPAHTPDVKSNGLKGEGGFSRIEEHEPGVFGIVRYRGRRPVDVHQHVGKRMAGGEGRSGSCGGVHQTRQF